MSSRGQQNHIYGGRVISVSSGCVARLIGIDGPPDAIKDTIKTVFELRTNRAFWLEDGNHIVRTIDRDMPQGNYTLHVDEGLMIKLCSFYAVNNAHRGSPGVPNTEDKIFYSDDDLRDFLYLRGWICLREYGSSRDVQVLDELQRGGIYCGISRAQFSGHNSDDGYYS